MSLAMPQLRRFDPSIPPPIGKRRCPFCGEPMLLLSILRADEGHDQRIFECSSCPYAETTIVKFEESSSSAL
jgi:hypothetical protein